MALFIKALHLQKLVHLFASRSSGSISAVGGCPYVGVPLHDGKSLSDRDDISADDAVGRHRTCVLAEWQLTGDDETRQVCFQRPSNEKNDQNIQLKEA
jgi:hypothetical protein